MAVSHQKSNTVADFTGTFTGFNSQGSTATFAATDLVRPSDWNSAHNQYYSLAGNTAGDSTASGTNVVFQGAGAVTLSGNADTIVFSAAAQTTQPVAFSASGGSSNFSTLVFSNGSGVTFSNSNGSVMATVKTDYQSSNANYLTAQTVQTQASGAIAGSGFTSAGANISLSGTMNSLGLSLSASVAAPGGGAQTAISGIIASDATYTSGTVSFSNQANITIGSSVNGATQYIRLSGNAAQTNQTVASGGIAGSGFTSGGNNIGLSGTHNSAGLSLSATVAAQTAQTQSNVQGIIVSNTTYRTGDVSFSNVNGISFGSSAGQAITASYTVPSVTQYFSKTNTTFNGANISGSMTHNTDGLQLSLSVAAPGGGANFTAFATSNTTQSSTGVLSSNSMIFAGAGIASVGVSNGSVVISVPAGGGAGDGGVFAGVSTAGNTAGSTGTVSTGNFVLVGTGALTLSQSTGAAGSAATITFSVPQTSSLVGTNGISVSSNGSTISISGVPTYTALTYQNRQLGASTGSVPGQNSVWLCPMRIAAPVNASTGMHMVSITGSVTSNQTNTVGITWDGMLYKVTGANQSQLDSIFSTRLAFTVWNSGTVSVSYSYDGGSSSSAGSNLMTASVYGNRQLTFNIGSTLDPGFYAWGFRQSTSSAGQSSILRSFNAVMDNPMPLAQGFFGSATNASIGYGDAGTYSATSAAMPASFNLTQVMQTLNVTPYFKMGAI